MLAQSFMTIVAASAVLAAPTTKLARDDLKPWQITSLLTHEPSGRPGNDPHSYLRFSIEDSNTISAAQTPTGQAVFTPTSAECSLEWLTNDDVPWGVEQPCVTGGNTTDYSTWTFTINKTGDEQSNAATNFNLAFKLVDKVTVPGSTVVKTFTAEDDFKVGDNMRGQCGGSGVCSWGLNQQPYAVKQTEITE